MLAWLDALMGGRAAEELIFGIDHITSGASDDLLKATALATRMVKLFGMSEKVIKILFESIPKLTAYRIKKLLKMAKMI